MNNRRRAHLLRQRLRFAVGPVLGLMLVGCALFKNPTPQPTKPQNPYGLEPFPKTPDIAYIADVISRFNDAVRTKEFDLARALLGRAERALRAAGPKTRSHPEFSDKEAIVERSEEKLRVAVKQYELAQREQAIDELIRRGKKAMAKGQELLRELSVRPPTQDDMRLFNATLETLEQLEAEGSGYLNEHRYKLHADRRDRFTIDFAQRKTIAEWQLRLTRRIAPAISSAYAAIDRARAATNGSKQLQALRTAQSSFTTCVNAVSDLAVEDAYDGQLQVKTPLGRLGVDETKRQCLQNAAEVRSKADKLAWLRRVNDVMSPLTRAFSRLRAASGPQNQLAATPAALEALVVCQEKLPGIRELPGHQPDKTFKTALGRQTLAQLQKACRKQQASLLEQRSVWRWRKEYVLLNNRLTETARLEKQARKARQPDSKIELWEQVLAQLSECAQEARDLANAPTADLSYRYTSAYGTLPVRALADRCAQGATKAEQKLGKARGSKELQAFVRQLNNDAKAVALREGIPDDIKEVDGGQVFVYVGSDGSKRTFGFDRSGQRVDFGARWRRSVQELASRVDTALAKVTRAKRGKAKLNATKRALEVLDDCHASLDNAQTQPGYLADAKFRTQLGNLDAVTLGERCSQRHAELTQSIPALEWRVRLEATSARAKQAKKQLAAAATVDAPKKRVELVGAALGGFTECLERTEALQTAPGADPSLRIVTPFGSLNLAPLSKACEVHKLKAEKRLDKALELEALQSFLQTCQGDEKSVAKRYGKPDEVENVGDGRIFIYIRKGDLSDRRIAFDAAGDRIAEKLLRARAK